MNLSELVSQIAELVNEGKLDEANRLALQFSGMPREQTPAARADIEMALGTINTILESASTKKNSLEKLLRILNK